jgi:hypothetical protein
MKSKWIKGKKVKIHFWHMFILNDLSNEMTNTLNKLRKRNSFDWFLPREKASLNSAQLILATCVLQQDHVALTWTLYTKTQHRYTSVPASFWCLILHAVEKNCASDTKFSLQVHQPKTPEVNFIIHTQKLVRLQDTLHNVTHITRPLHHTTPCHNYEVWWNLGCLGPN